MNTDRPLPRRRDRALGGLLLLAATVCSACVPALTVEPPRLAGTFRGDSAAGEPLVVTFDEDDQAFHGSGSEAGEPLVVAGPVVWHGVGSLVRADGSTRQVELRLSADGERLELVEGGDVPVVLERGAAVAEPSAGPSARLFSGSYRATRGPATLARVRLIQRGDLVAGSAAILGEPVGVSGRVRSPARMEGAVLFPDGSEVAFAAELSADGETLRMEGFGTPLTLARETRR